MPILSRVPRGAWAVALVFIVGSVIVGSVIVGSMRVQTAHAYGNTSLWQVGLSFNCDNPSVCGATNLGGFWGWVEFDSGGLGDAELTGCGHLQGGPGGGAQHFSVAITSWTIGSNGDFIVSGTGTNAGHGGGSFPLVDMDTGIPAAAGHYTTQMLLGMQAPGVSFQIQVVQLQ